MQERAVQEAQRRIAVRGVPGAPALLRRIAVQAVLQRPLVLGPPKALGRRKALGPPKALGQARWALQPMAWLGAR